MTDEPFTSSRRAIDGLDRYSVIAVSFEDDRKADDALTLLRELDSRQQVAVEEAVVVVHQEDGQVIEQGRIESKFLPGTTGGGLLGLLIGIVGGPFGMLIGAAGGLLAGSVFDVHDRDDDESMLGAISSSVRAGRTALLAVVTEESPEVIDAAMAGLAGTVLRRPVPDVEAEIAAAENAERKAKRQARKELLRGRHERDKAATSAKIDELKAKLHGDQNTPAASAGNASTTSR